MFKTMLENVVTKAPLIHAITNYVTVNDCANIVLACGAAPIMADDENEVEEITSLCQALVINIGTLNARTIEAMRRAAKQSALLGHPLVLDPVGAGASKLRTATAMQLLRDIKFSVIRGNISEIKTIAQGTGSTKGVEADVSDAVTENNLDEAIVYMKNLSAQTGAIIAVTGAIDIIADSGTAYLIRNGHPLMSKITGSGCMLSCLVAAYCAANPAHLLDATAAAVGAMGLCGELAYANLTEVGGGTSTFRTLLIDSMSKLDSATLSEGIKIESR
jgi:hydroxyethylthiazole kinase